MTVDGEVLWIVEQWMSRRALEAGDPDLAARWRALDVLGEWGREPGIRP